MTGSDRQEAWGVNKSSAPYQRSQIEISAAVRPHQGPLLMNHLCSTISNYHRRMSVIPKGDKEVEDEKKHDTAAQLVL